MPSAIFLEFKHQPGNLAANGTDVVFYVDGRWSAETTRHRVLDRVRELRMSPRGSTYAEQLFVGYTHSGGRGGAIVGMADPEPPAWFCELPDDDKTFAHEIRLSDWRRKQASNRRAREYVDSLVLVSATHSVGGVEHDEADCPGTGAWPCTS